MATKITRYPARKKSQTMRATLGGAFLVNSRTPKSFRDTYGEVGYVWVDLPSGERLQLFYNNETRLFVADVVAPDENGGVEFVRRTVPSTSLTHLTSS